MSAQDAASLRSDLTYAYRLSLLVKDGRRSHSAACIMFLPVTLHSMFYGVYNTSPVEPALRSRKAILAPTWPALDDVKHTQYLAFSSLGYRLRYLLFIITPSCMSGSTDCMGRRESALGTPFHYTRADYKLFHSLRTVAVYSGYFSFSDGCSCVYAVVSVFSLLWYLFASPNNISLCNEHSSVTR